MIMVTLLLAFYNWHDEGHSQFFLVSTFGSIAGACFSTGLYRLATTNNWANHAGYGVAAFSVTFISLAVYGYYGFNGPAENSNESSAHMHIIVMPILLLSVSVFMSLVFVLVSLVRSFKSRQNDN